MLFRLVRPMNRAGTEMKQFVRRIPAEVRSRAIGRTFTIRLTDIECVTVRITDKMGKVRFSLRSRDPAEVKIRHARALEQLEIIWRGLRDTNAPVILSRRDAHALAGELYRAWADDRRDRNLAATHDPVTRTWTIERLSELAVKEEDECAFAIAVRKLTEAADCDGLEPVLGPLADRMLLAKGLRIEPECRPVLLDAFCMALRQALEHRHRNAQGDYRPDPKADRFPEWSAPSHASAPSTAGSKDAKPAQGKATVTLSGLVEAWWTEAKAAGRKLSTFESYRSTMGKMIAFLRHDDAARVTREDVIRFKDHRIASGVRPKTVNDNDLSGLKTIFGWAAMNGKLPSNPAAGLTIKVGKPPKVRSKGFTDTEARAILSAASQVQRDRERPQTAAAKRWVPWLCAYTGARVGEMAQLRKEDVRQEGELWVLTVTPEAGTVKTDEARAIVLHPHLIEQGFPEFVAAARPGHLFLRPSRTGDVRGPWRSLKNRLQEFARTIVPDRNVAPNHAWRHRFKTVGMEAGIDTRILDAIQGHAPPSVAAGYGEVTLRTLRQPPSRSCPGSPSQSSAGCRLCPQVYSPEGSNQHEQPAGNCTSPPAAHKPGVPDRSPPQPVIGIFGTGSLEATHGSRPSEKLKRGCGGLPAPLFPGR